MMKKTSTLLIAALLLMAIASGAMAESLEGTWSGSAKVSVLPISLSATVSFKDGIFTASVIGLKATGGYVDSGDGTLTLRVTSFSGLLASQLVAPEDVGSISVRYSFDDSGRLLLNGGAGGVDGSLSLKRK